MDPRQIVVIGPMSSGCRLLRRILEASPNLSTWLDRSHGTKPLEPQGIPEEAVPILIFRKKWATDSSREAFWANKPEDYVSYQDSIDGIKIRYPNAFRVSYEKLCANPDQVIFEIASYLNIEPWMYDQEEIINQNDKWKNGGGPQLPIPPIH